MSIADRLRDKRILCICEGAAEMDIMNMLLENNRLIFTNEELIDNKVHKR